MKKSDKSSPIIEKAIIGRCALIDCFNEQRKITEKDDYVSIKCSFGCAFYYHSPRCWRIIRTNLKDNFYRDCPCLTPECEGLTLSCLIIDSYGKVRKTIIDSLPDNQIKRKSNVKNAYKSSKNAIKSFKDGSCISNKEDKGSSGKRNPSEILSRNSIDYCQSCCIIGCANQKFRSRDIEKSKSESNFCLSHKNAISNDSIIYINNNSVILSCSLESNVISSSKDSGFVIEIVNSDGELSIYPVFKILNNNGKWLGHIGLYDSKSASKFLKLTSQFHHCKSQFLAKHIGRKICLFDNNKSAKSGKK